MKNCYQILFALALIVIMQNTLYSQGYYKDLFIDNGVGLQGLSNIAAADSLNLSSEFIFTADTSTQNSLLSGNSNDENGVLLYPDGEPRFRLVYTNGGNAWTHINSMRSNSKERIGQFYNNGGSYTGSCAGAIIASTRSNKAGPYYGLWPRDVIATDLYDTFTGHFIPPVRHC